MLTPENIPALEKTVSADRLKPKSHIQWVAFSNPSKEEVSRGRIASPVECEVRMYGDLFLHANPMDKNEVPGGWLSDINPKSLEIFKGFAEPAIGPSGLDLTVESKVQFMRIGYFCVDKDTKISMQKNKIWVPRLVDGKVVGEEEEIERTVGWVWNRTVGLREDNNKN
jgi:hypothetical protein